MKKQMVLMVLMVLSVFLILTVFGCHSGPQKGGETILGKWYGSWDGCETIFEFREDMTMSCTIPGVADYSFECKYTVDYNTDPISVDLIGLSLLSYELNCTSIAEFNGGNEMEFHGLFGPPGLVQRPKEFNRNVSSLEGICVKFTRNPQTKNIETVKSFPPQASIPFDRNERLGRGLNLSGVLDGDDGVVPTKEAYFKKVKEAGFNHLRVPIRWSSYCSKEPPYTIEPSFFKEVDWVVEQCLKNDLAVILDFHYYPMISFFGAQDIEDWGENIERFYSLWEQIAEHYKGYSEDVFFDILNEPSSELGVEGWNELVAKTITIIRKNNPDRTILVNAPNSALIASIGGLEIPRNEWNVIVEVHYYMPINFTHQGASWVGEAAEYWLGTKWTANPKETAAVQSDMEFAASWAERNHRPLYLGEFGAYEKADMESRACYTDYVCRTAEKKGMSFAVWSFSRAGFDVYNEAEDRWIQPLLEALVHPE